MNFEQAEVMRKAKIGAVASSSKEGDSSQPTGPSLPPQDLDESFQLLRPTKDTESEESGSDDSDEDLEVSADMLHDEIQGVYEDWLFSLDRDDNKMMAMMLYDII